MSAPTGSANSWDELWAKPERTTPIGKPPKWDWEAAWAQPESTPAGKPAPLREAGGTGYGRAALAAETRTVAEAAEGVRNDTLNRAGFSLAQLVAAGHLEQAAVHQALTDAARAAGLDDKEIGATLRSSLTAGVQQPRDVPDRPPLPTPTVLEDDYEAATMDAAAAFARAVDSAAYDLRVREAARVKVATERAGEAPLFDAGLLADILARPTEPPHRVDGLIPSEAATEVVAQRKTGKTTFELNLARSLLTGEDFLGRFGVRRIDGCVGFLNYEVSPAQLARWADEVGVDRRRLFLVNLRGRRNPLGNDDDRAELAEQLRAHEVESVFVDPFGRAFIGKSQNDPGEVGAWLADLDRWARGDVGAVDVILSAHAGWDGERTRGASALEDWADSIITIVRDRDDDQLRFLKAEGRDVLVEEDRLDYDPSTRRLTLAGAGSRKHAARTRHLDELVPLVVGAVTAEPGLTGYKLQKVLREAGASYQRGDEVKAAKLAVERGQLVVEDGPRNSKRYSPAPTYPDLSRPIPVGQVTTYPDLPSIEREVVTGRSDGPPIPADQAHLDSDDDLCPGCVQPTADPAPSTCPCPDLHTEPGRLS